MRIIAIAIPAIAPVLMPEPLFVDFVIVALVEVGSEGFAPVVLVDVIATIWRGVLTSNVACETEKFEFS